MTIWKRWIQHSVLCGLVLGGLVAFATIASAEGMPPVTDHAALAAWYDNEAAQLRQKAKDMGRMQQRYIDEPHLYHMEGRTAPKFDMVQHCNNLIGIYTKAAEEADDLSRGHRSMVK